MNEIVYTVDAIGDEALTASIINKSITEIVDKSVTTIRQSAFYQCKNLRKADFLLVNTISSNAFNGCTALVALVLRSTSMVGGYSPLEGSAIASGTGYLYVPAALVDTYKANYGWQTYADQIRALENYTVDGTTTGALDETKI